MIVEAVSIWNHLSAWREARYEARSQGKSRPGFGRFIDPTADMTVALTRALLGCAAGALLHGQVTGSYAAVTTGAAAPALLAGLGKAARRHSEGDVPRGGEADE